MSSPLHLLYAIDINCLPLAKVSLASCLLNTSVASVRVVTPSGTNIDELKRVADDFSIPLRQVEMKEEDSIHRLSPHLRPYFYCISALQNLPSGRYLLLDADTLCVRDLQALEKLELTAATPLAACSHGRPMPDRQLALRLGGPFDYINAGVLLVEANTLGNSLNTERVMSFYENHAAICRFREQCTINALMAGAITYLPLRYNLLSWMRSRARRSHWQQLAYNPMAATLQEERQQAAIVHFSNGCLPHRVPWWSRDSFDHYWLELSKLLSTRSAAPAPHRQPLPRYPAINDRCVN